MKHIKKISYNKALKAGYIGEHDFCRCYFCESEDLGVDQNQNNYTEDVGGYHPLVEYGVVCNKCHMNQGYVSYGQVDPVYVKEPRSSFFLKTKIKT